MCGGTDPDSGKKTLWQDIKDRTNIDESDESVEERKLRDERAKKKEQLAIDEKAEKDRIISLPIQMAAAQEASEMADKKKSGKRKSRRSTILTSNTDDQSGGYNLGSGLGKKRLGS